MRKKILSIVLAMIIAVSLCTPVYAADNGFSDVSGDHVFHDAILWAAEQGITGGYADGTFRPSADCTRGQVVTFLWRMAGEPEAAVAENSFSDVSDGPYYDAILWAVGEGITGG